MGTRLTPSGANRPFNPECSSTAERFSTLYTVVLKTAYLSYISGAEVMGLVPFRYPTDESSSPPSRSSYSSAY
jgi:hypothetical protein